MADPIPEEVGFQLEEVTNRRASRGLAHDQGISKAGNRKGRTTRIELAWLWLRYRPDSDLSVWFRMRVAKGHIRRIAIVALARKLLVALRYRCVLHILAQGIPNRIKGIWGPADRRRFIASKPSVCWPAT